jgi:holo-[acyl-carrier protein] synthase
MPSGETMLTKGRFAAKEAIRKACDHFGMSERAFHRIMILPVASNDRITHQSVRPRGLILDKEFSTPYTGASDSEDSAQGPKKKYGSGMHVDVNSLDGQLCEISISHDGDFATAVALVPSRPEAIADIESSKADESEPHT